MIFFIEFIITSSKKRQTEIVLAEYGIDINSGNIILKTEYFSYVLSMSVVFLNMTEVNF